MKQVNLKAYRAKEISFGNSVAANARIEFQNSYSYNVNYAPNNTCKGEMTISAESKEDPKKFFVKVVVEGIFEFDPAEKKEVIHVCTFKELFPVAKAIVATVTTAAGVPPILIPSVDIESQSIYRYDFRKPDSGEGSEG